METVGTVTINKRLSSIFIIVLVFSDCVAVLPLRDQWAAANRAMIRNQAGEAYRLFAEFNQWYGDERTVKAPGFREKQYRLWGLSALQAGFVGDGIPLLETWLDENPEQQQFRAFIRFQLANSYLATNDTRSAEKHWAKFIEDHAELPECALVRWLWAELLVSQANYKDAKIHLQSVTANDRLPISGRILANSALALVLMEEGQVEDSFERLESLMNNPVSHIWRAILAPVLTARFLEKEQAAMAWRAAGWFDSPDRLVAAYGEYFMPKPRATSAARQAVWDSHWRNQMEKASISIRTTIESGFGLKELYLLKLRACTGNKSHLEAHILSHYLLDTKLENLAGIREKAFLYNIEANIALEKWDYAENTIRQFLRDYPENPEIPNILFLRARNLAARNLFPEAVSTVNQLIDTYPDHESVLVWKFKGAGWCASSGNVKQALDTLIAMEKECPEQWKPYVQFEQGRCLEQLQQMDRSVAVYSALASATKYPALSEQATIALMKIFLSQFNQPAFQSAHDSFRERFPYSRNLLMTELLSASFKELSGQIDEAMRIYSSISQEDCPESDFAHAQLSRVYSAQKDYESLREHALNWIQQTLNRSGNTSGKAFEDCLLYQRLVNRPSLPEALVSLLADRLDNNDARFPSLPFLSLLENQWPHYRGILDAGNPPYLEWIESAARAHYEAGRLDSWCVAMLHSAEILEGMQRNDSADTRRIQVLTNANPDDLGKRALFEIASVAHRYDFPESEPLLKLFIGKYKEADELPECLHMLAESVYQAGDIHGSLRMLETIFRDWQDSQIYNVASLQLAHRQYSGKNFDRASEIVEAMLDRGGLNPRQTAEMLLLRARLDLQSGNMERCRLDCRRIMTLYPNFSDIFEDAEIIIKSSRDA